MNARTIDIVNQQRFLLIGRKFDKGLTESEAKQLEQLNEEMNVLCPRVSVDEIAQLKTLTDMLGELTESTKNMEDKYLLSTVKG